MSYKSIVSFACNEEDAAGRVGAAIEVARHFDAHLTVLALAYEPEMSPAAYGEIPIAAIVEWRERAEQQSLKLTERLNHLLQGAEMKGEAKPLVSSHLGMARLFRSEALFSDLVVLSLTGANAEDRAAIDLIEDAAFYADATTLICPKGMTKPPGDTVLIGWNGQREAMRAVRRAMPFLQRASKIEVTMIDPPASDGVPGGDLALFLSRHGLRVEISALPGVGESASQVLRRRIVDLGADLLVIGAYGHSRLREVVLGGVTRDFLRDPPIATIMAH